MLIIFILFSYPLFTLNSLLTFYEKGFKGNNQDIHVLVSTDTFLGKTTSKLIEDFLSPYFTVVSVTPHKLNTKNKLDFQSGIRDLLRWCDETLNGYKESGYEIIFNLTGGFKSLQGYLNTIGMFYADKIIYIFESSPELITIPKLPINIDKQVFKEKADLFLQLSQTRKGIEESKLDSIPGVLLEEYESGLYLLSDWGELSWNNVKRDVLDQLIELPRLKYLKSFEDDFKREKNNKEKVMLLETLAKISCILQETNGNITQLKGGNAGGMLYDNFTGKFAHLGHFRLGQGPRVSCEYKNGVLELRHFGTHDYVNNNP